VCCVVEYFNNSDQTLNTKTDAKGQVFTYLYDSYKRLITIKLGSAVLRTFIYDTNTLDSTYSGSFTAGRLVAVQNAAFTPQGYVPGQGGSNVTVPSSIQFVEMYNYTQAGLTHGKRLQALETFHWYVNNVLQTSNQTLNMDGTYTYDTGGEGKIASVNYPTTYSFNGTTLVPNTGPTYTYSFDAMYRPTGLTDQNSNTLVNNVSYNPANQLLTFNTETRTYNNLNQMTRLTITGSAPLDITYNFPAGANNGKISSQKDNLSVETVTYQYDSLNRLISASSSQSWSETYGFDAFGNLLSKTGVGGAPTLSQSVNTATNQIVGQTYDSNGNQSSGPLGAVTYDAENRIASMSSGGVQYAYDSRNKRVWSSTLTGGNLSQFFYYYGMDGQKLAIYPMSLVLINNVTPLMTDNTNIKLSQFFGSKRIGTFDRLGTAKYDQQNGAPMSFYPYGEDRGTVQPNDSLKFATYTRDAATGLDYADQRYYANNFGRFMSPDRHRRSAKLGDPGSWNRYPYTRGDPINRNDPSGRCDVYIAGIIMNNANSPGFQAAADSDNADSVYAYSNQSNNSSLLKKLGNTLYGIAMVAAQAFGPNSSTYAAVVGLELAAGDSNPINVVTFSGGAAALTAAVNYLNSQGTAGQAVVGMIGNITYVAPGAVGSLYDNGQVSVIEGGGLANTMVGALTGVPGNATVYNDTQHCGHNFACLANEFPDAFTQGDPCSAPAIVNQDRTIHYRNVLPNPFSFLNYYFDWLWGWAAGGPEDDGAGDNGDDDGGYQIMQ